MSLSLVDLVELIVAVGVAQPKKAPLEPLNVTYNESKAKSRPWADESLTSSRSTVVGSLLPIGWRRDAIEAGRCLVAGDDPTLGIDGHRDPRATRLLRHGEQSLDLKTGQQMERVAGAASEAAVGPRGTLGAISGFWVSGCHRPGRLRRQHRQPAERQPTSQCPRGDREFHVFHFANIGSCGLPRERT